MSISWELSAIVGVGRFSALREDFIQDSIIFIILFWDKTASKARVGRDIGIGYLVRYFD